jgi:hypothetical protein
VTSGYIEVVVLPTNNVVNTGAAQAVLHIDAPGTYRIPFSQANNVNRAIGIQWGKVICDIQVTGCIVETASTTDGLSAWMTEICVNRAGLTAAEIDTAGTIATLAGVGYTLCYYQQQQNAACKDILQGALDAHTGSMWQDRNKVLKVGRLVDPASLTSVASFDDRTVIGDIIVDDDFAQGLSARMAGQKNYTVHSAGDVAGSVINTAFGTSLQQEFLTIATGVGVLDAFYYEAAFAGSAVRAFLDRHACADRGDARRRHAVQTAPQAVDVLGHLHRRAKLHAGTVPVHYADHRQRRQYFHRRHRPQRYSSWAGQTLSLVIISATSRFLSDVVNFVCWG